MEIRKLIPFARRHLVWLVFGTTLTIIGVAAAMVPPYLVRLAVDDVIRASAEDGDYVSRWRYLALLVAGMAMATAVRAGSIFGKNMLLETFSQRILRDLKQSLYDHIQRLSFHFFHNTRTGELMARMTNDMEMIRVFLVLGVMHGATGLFYVVISAAILFTINWQLALVSIAAAPFLLMTTVRFRRSVYPRFQAVRAQYSNLNTAVQENISGIRVVKSFMRYDHELEKFQHENRGLTKRRDQALDVWATFMPIIEFLSGISAALMLLVGGRMVINDVISLGVWVQFSGYLWMIMMPMRMLGEVVNHFTLATASAERVFEILETDPHIESAPGAITPFAIKGDVEFRNVSWSADGTPVLKNVSLHAKAGATIAIMGATGSGKSSLVHLIPRFYDPDEGAVFIDGVDAKMLTLPVLRENVGLVAQETFLFSETMYNNIAYGRRGAPPEFVQRVAAQTQAHMFIDSMTAGYDTVVGERGVGLSGGQRQRTSIARTLLKEAPILILDDATSAVDMETESLIQKALKNLDHRVTTFIVAHRISSVKHADEILILANGEIVERGTHDELIAAGGEYAAIFELQYQDADTMREKN
jgi:ATP-binding cassette, subfamily B, multidrug efflux pump